VKYYWEIIADNLSEAGWSYGYVSAVDLEGRTIWIADAHRGDGKRFVVLLDEKLKPPLLPQSHRAHGLTAEIGICVFMVNRMILS
jgi:hypothetical protein